MTEKKEKIMENTKNCCNLTPTPPILVNEISRLFSEWMRRTRVDPLQAQHSCRMLLRSLGHMEGCTQLDLVKETHLKPPTVSVTLKKLEENGYVERRADEHDLRAIRVTLTDKGRALNESSIARCKKADSIFMQGITEEEVDVLLRALTKMRNNMIEKLESEPDPEQ